MCTNLPSILPILFAFNFTYRDICRKRRYCQKKVTYFGDFDLLSHNHVIDHVIRHVVIYLTFTLYIPDLRLQLGDFCVFILFLCRRFSAFIGFGGGCGGG